MPPVLKLNLPPEIALRRVISMRQATEITNLSKDTLKRRYPDKIVKLSVRRSGMRLADALAIGQPIAGPATA